MGSIAYFDGKVETYIDSSLPDSKKLGMINDRPHYTSDDGEHGIWHDGNSWNVGKVGEKGTNRSGLYAKSLENCPEDPTYSWQYLAGNGEFKPANKGFSIYCKY